MTRRLLACVVLLAGLAAAQPRASALDLQPTSTCPQEAIDQISRAIDFVRGQAWADSPGDKALNIAPDLTTCEVVLHIGHLSDREQAALETGAGSRLAVEYRKDWARPSRILLTLWIVFGGSGLIWIYRRYARR